MKYEQIDEMLHNHLALITDLPEVIRQNQAGYIQSAESVSTRTSSYIRTTLIPVESFAGSIGQGGTDVYPFVFRVEFFTPASMFETGAVFAHRLADELANHFKRGTQLIDGQDCIMTEKVYNLPPQQNTNYYLSSTNIEGYIEIER